MSLALTNLDRIGTIASNATGVVSQVINGIDRYQNLKADEDAYIRLLYLEILHNLEVLETIKEDGLNGVKHNDDAFKEFINQLSLDVMAGIFAPGGKKNKKIFDFLADNGEIKYTNKSGVLIGQEDITDEKVIETSVLKTIVFLVTKIEMLKKIANVGNQDFMKTLRLKPRIKNIKIRLAFLKEKIKNYEKLEAMT